LPKDPRAGDRGGLGAARRGCDVRPGRARGIRHAARQSLLAGLAAAALASPPIASAQTVEVGQLDGPFQVVGDEVEYQADRDAYVVRGNVVITQKGRRLTADRVLFSNRTGIGIASGQVVLTEGEDTLTSDLVQFNANDMTGVVFRGRLDSRSSLFEMEGEEVQKTGEKTYRFTKGRFTSCRCPDPEDREPWHLTAQKADLELEGYARARNATFEVLGVPVLWAPYVIYPLKTDRQTGLLFPDAGVSERNGFEISLPFFWAARENVNVTITPEYLTKRGFKPSTEVEYVFGKRGAGQVYGTFISDSEVDRDDPETPFSQQRWGTRFEHMMDLPARSWLALDGAVLSDNEIPFDFDDFDYYRADRYLHSRGLTATRFGPSDVFGFETALLVTDDLQNPDDQDRDNLLLQRLPELNWSAAPGGLPVLPGLVASADVQYVNFQRFGDANDATRALRVGDFFFDTGADGIPNPQERDANGNRDPGIDVHNDGFSPAVPGRSEGNGVFDEGEPLADQGHRVVARPRLSYPFHLARVVGVVPEVGWYGTFYDTDRVGAEVRHLFTGRLDVRSRARGELDLPFGMGRAGHWIEPHVSWVVLEGDDGRNNPLLIPNTAVPQDRLRQLAIDNLLLDPSDRLSDVNSLVFGVKQRFLSRRVGSLVGELDVSGEYRFEGQEFGPAVVQGNARLPRGWWVRGHASVDVEEAEFADGLASTGWSHPFGHIAGLRYRYLRDIPRFFEAFVADDDRFGDFAEGFLRVNQIGGFLRGQITQQWAATYAGNYSFENSLSLSHQFGLEYLSKCRCWAVRLEAQEDRVRGLSWSINYRLLGLGDDRERPFQGPSGRRFDAVRGL
jgi:lipopolysaccharide assembly outer membrane protein LptD (OstA)